MPAIPPIKKNDEVFILRGKDRGKTGRVLIVIPKAQKIVVEELSAAGLQVEKIVNDWPEGDYCVLFVKR